MFKLIILILGVVLLNSEAYAQSKYGFTTGIDTTALAHSIKSRTMYRINLYSDSLDSIFYTKHYYDTSGYITRYEFQNLTYSYISWSPIHPQKFNSVDFEYSNGYLIREGYNMSGPRASGTHGKDTTLKIVETTWQLFDDVDRIKESKTTYIYTGGYVHSSEETYGYLPNGQIDFMETKYVHTRYIYSEDDLLIEKERINEFGVFEREFFTYEFY